MKRYLLLFCLFIQATLNGFSQVNLVLNRPVTVSSFNTGYEGYKAVDGDKVSNASRWWTWRGTSHSPQWIVIDLERDCNITGIAFWTGAVSGGTLYYSQTNEDFAFQYWNGTTWITIFTETGNTDPTYEKNFDPVIVNKVRMYITKAQNDQVRLFEIEVYGNSVPTGINQLIDSPKAIVLPFPNPVSDKDLTVLLKGFGTFGPVYLSISDLTGRQVFKRKVDPTELEGLPVTVSRNVFTNGIYFIKAENETGVCKVVKLIVL